MIKKLFYVSALLLSLDSFGCGGSSQEIKDLNWQCVDLLSSCEFSASRSSRSIFEQWINLRDCSYDYGNCVSNPETDCIESCKITYIASSCVLACIQTSTSTSAE